MSHSTNETVFVPQRIFYSEKKQAFYTEENLEKQLTPDYHPLFITEPNYTFEAFQNVLVQKFDEDNETITNISLTYIQEVYNIFDPRNIEVNYKEVG